MARLFPLIALLSAPLVAVAAMNPSPDAIDPSQVVRHLANMPARGSTMQAVRSDLGPPDRQIAPVGDPPISRWVYDDFTVYFERNRVIDAVAHTDHSDTGTGAD